MQGFTAKRNRSAVLVMNTDTEILLRIRRALGDTPVPDATHVLPPLTVPELPPYVSGPDTATAFVIDLAARGETAFLRRAETVQATFAPFHGLSLGTVNKWTETRYRRGCWVRLETVAPDIQLSGIALSWELASLLTEGAAAVSELAEYAVRATQGAEHLGLVAVPREPPAAAAARASQLIDLKQRFSQSVEMRLLPQGRGFPSRSIWRLAYALGFGWDGKNFFWDGGTKRPQITLSAVGLPGAFLPERAAEGEGTLGIALSFEIPPSPDPLGVYDRMANVLAYLRQQLGGHPVTPDGQELDAERLWDDRDQLQETVQAMTTLHLSPGSPAALRFF